jgi:hypothetical protein
VTMDDPHDALLCVKNISGMGSIGLYKAVRSSYTICKSTSFLFVKSFISIIFFKGTRLVLFRPGCRWQIDQSGNSNWCTRERQFEKRRG